MSQKILDLIFKKRETCLLHTEVYCWFTRVYDKLSSFSTDEGTWYLHQTFKLLKLKHHIYTPYPRGTENQGIFRNHFENIGVESAHFSNFRTGYGVKDI